MDEKKKIVGPLAAEGVCSVYISETNSKGEWIGLKFFLNKRWIYFGPLAPANAQISSVPFLPSDAVIKLADVGWIQAMNSKIAGGDGREKVFAGAVLNQGFKAARFHDLVPPGLGIPTAPNGDWLTGVSYIIDRQMAQHGRPTFLYGLEGPAARKTGLNQLRWPTPLMSQLSKNGSWAVSFRNPDGSEQQTLGMIEYPFLERLISLYGIQSVEVFEFVDHLRLDRRWVVLFYLAEKFPREAKEHLQKMVRDMLRNPRDRFFDYDEAIRLIDGNKSFFYQALSELMPEEIKRFVFLVGLPLNEVLTYLTLEASQKLVQLIPPPEIKKRIADAEKGLPKLSVNRDLVKLANIYELIRQSPFFKEGNRTEQEEKEQKDFFEYLELALKRFKELNLSFSLEAQDLEDLFLFWHQEIIKEETGFIGDLFDVEIAAKEKDESFHFLRWLQQTTSQWFQVWSLDWSQAQRFQEHYERWQKINKGLNEILGKDFDGMNHSDASWFKEAEHNALIWLFLFGLSHLLLSFVSAKLKKKEKFLLGWYHLLLSRMPNFVREKLESLTWKEVVAQIWKENSWFNVQTNLKAQVIAKNGEALFSDEVGKLNLTREQKAILDLLRFVARENVFEENKTWREKAVQAVKRIFWIPSAFEQRQRMNHALLKLAQKVGTKIKTVDGFYQELAKIGEKYQSASTASQLLFQESVVDVEALFQKVGEKLKEGGAVVIPTPQSQSQKINGSLIPESSQGGLEFSEFKEYSPGEDVRHIDTKKSAGRQHYVVKRYDREGERNTSLLIDLSSLADPASHDRWADELILSVKAQLAKYRIQKGQGDFKIDSVLFVLADGSLKTQKLTHLKGKGKNSLEQLIFNLTPLIRKQLEKQQADAGKANFNLERKFYSEEKNKRYVEQVKDIFKRQREEKLKAGLLA
ncbi:MAG: DUF58 domain-containing protein, partial [Chlamydiia bacterium]|nr:DUF58 domain-containing protein [Chlamydiia bacterium]